MEPEGVLSTACVAVGFCGGRHSPAPAGPPRPATSREAGARSRLSEVALLRGRLGPAISCPEHRPVGKPVLSGSSSVERGHGPSTGTSTYGTPTWCPPPPRLGTGNVTGGLQTQAGPASAAPSPGAVPSLWPVRLLTPAAGGCRIQFAPDTAQAWAPSRAEEVAAARPRGSARPHLSPLLLPTPQWHGLSRALGKSELHRILGALSGLRGKAAWNPIFQTPLSRRGAGPAWGRGADGDRGGLEKGRGRLLLPPEQEAVSCRPFWNVPPQELFLEAASPRHLACAPPP